MSTTTTLAAGMTAARQNRADAWRFLTGFVADWRAPLAPGDGFPAEELDAAEQRLGLRLPTALREAHMLLGRRGDLCRNQDPLLAPDKLFVYEGALVYQAENQGVAHWGILVADLEDDDPPAFHRISSSDPGEEWHPWCDRLSVALVELVMAETARHWDGLSNAADLVEAVVDGFAPLPALLPERGESKWYAAEDLLLHVVGDAWMTVRARDAASLEALCESVYAEWIG
jgi:hypothetical protein